jgi:hypothetical protein
LTVTPQLIRRSRVADLEPEVARSFDYRVAVVFDRLQPGRKPTEVAPTNK